jgi:hypothetical protein
LVRLRVTFFGADFDSSASTADALDAGARRDGLALDAFGAGSAVFFLGLLRVADRLAKDHDSYPAPPAEKQAH